MILSWSPVSQLPWWGLPSWWAEEDTEPSWGGDGTVPRGLGGSGFPLDFLPCPQLCRLYPEDSGDPGVASCSEPLPGGQFTEAEVLLLPQTKPVQVDSPGTC